MNWLMIQHNTHFALFRFLDLRLILKMCGFGIFEDHASEILRGLYEICEAFGVGEKQAKAGANSGAIVVEGEGNALTSI